MKKKAILKEIEESVFSRNPVRVEQVIRRVPAADVEAGLLIGALSKGIERARAGFKQKAYSIPEFLLAIDAFRLGLKTLKEYAPDAFLRAYSPGRPRIVIGVIEGDVHDMGKNIVAAVLEASGYPVIDLGRDVPKERFIKHLDQEEASVLAVSAMMSTTLNAVQHLVTQVRDTRPEIGVIVGGAPFDDELARNIGAHGYAENAISTPEETRRLLAGNQKSMTNLQSR